MFERFIQLVIIFGVAVLFAVAASGEPFWLSVFHYYMGIMILGFAVLERQEE